MCCFLTIMVLLGPRAAIFFWWVYRPAYWSFLFPSWIVGLLGFFFLPWTTLMYAAVGFGGIVGIEWLFIILGVLADVASYSGGAYGNRGRIPGRTNDYQV
ncbi:hypothetical protein ACFLYO_06445 [Chloroflexota bacterium]